MMETEEIPCFIPKGTTITQKNIILEGALYLVMRLKYNLHHREQHRLYYIGNGGNAYLTG